MPPLVPTGSLGRDGPQIPRLGLGLMGLSAFRANNNSSDEERLVFLDRAHELGNRFWDSSDSYGDNEDLLAKWFNRSGKRDDIFLATKFGGLMEGEGVNFTYSIRTDPEYVAIACEKSLQRLGVEHIDLWYPHRLDGVTPIEHTVAAMAKCKEQGKVRHIGLVEVSADTLRRAHAVTHIACVQVEYNPFSMEIEDPKVKLLEACRELGVAVVAYSPLSRGLLTGQIKSWSDFEEGDARRMFPRFSEENFPKNLALVDAISALAERKGCTPGQLSLAWLMAQGDDIFPIPGTKRIAFLEENWGSLDVHLTPGEVADIRKIVDEAAVFGARYPEQWSGGLLGDTPPLPLEEKPH